MYICGLDVFINQVNMANEKLSKNQEFVKSNKDRLLNLYKNKYILVYEQEVVGSFDSYDVAA